jgi:hypothetical protein
MRGSHTAATAATATTAPRSKIAAIVVFVTTFVHAGSEGKAMESTGYRFHSMCISLLKLFLSFFTQTCQCERYCVHRLHKSF